MFSCNINLTLIWNSSQIFLRVLYKNESQKMNVEHRKSCKKNDNSNTNIRIRLIPRSSRNEIVGKENDVLKIKLTAPPVEGKANKALVQLLAKKLRVPKRDVEIVSGERSREKIVRVYGLSPGEIDRRLLDNV